MSFTKTRLSRFLKTFFSVPWVIHHISVIIVCSNLWIFSGVLLKTLFVSASHQKKLKGLSWNFSVHIFWNAYENFVLQCSPRREIKGIKSGLLGANFDRAALVSEISDTRPMRYHGKFQRVISLKFFVSVLNIRNSNSKFF